MDLPAAEPAPFKDATRILSSVLSSAERRVLRYLVLRMPRRINSDHLTALALVAMAGAGLSYWLSAVTPLGLWLATVCLALNWFGDSLDGTLARVRQHQRPRYGYYVDHVVDVAGAICLFGGLALSGYMHPVVAMGLLVAYLAVAVEVYLAAHVLGEFRLTIWTTYGTLNFHDAGGVAGIAGLGYTLLVPAIRHTRTLYRQEPIPK